MDKINILGVNVDMAGIEDAVGEIMKFLGEDSMHAVYTPNSEIIMAAYKDSEFCGVLNDADLLTADGIGVVYASKILKKPLTERAAGYDIACRLLEEITKSGHKLFLFGGKPGVAEEAKEKLEEKHSGINIVGTRNGYFSQEEVPSIIDEINSSGADIVFVCLGAPAQEKWIHANKDKLKTKVAVGLGGSLDIFAGRVERSPEIWCKLGLEWLHRLIREPWRFMRMMALPKFALTVFFKGKRYK
jgi:N-acetylglucosaminyldiphosphoundecaprenol N-acetyl-beta-D-mannosaminyltransferase